METFLRKWKLHRAYWRAATAQLCVPFYELRYEDLLSDPAEQLRLALASMKLLNEYQITAEAIDEAVRLFPPTETNTEAAAERLAHFPKEELEYVLANAKEELVAYKYMEMYHNALTVLEGTEGATAGKVQVLATNGDKEGSLGTSVIADTMKGTEAAAKIEKVHLSVILTVHNQEPYIEQVLQPLFEYTHLLFELIVVYDGCGDESERVVDEFIAVAGCKARMEETVATSNSCARYIKVFTE